MSYTSSYMQTFHKISKSFSVRTSICNEFRIQCQQKTEVKYTLLKIKNTSRDYNLNSSFRFEKVFEKN